jgi:hypothetical protein
MSELSEYLSEMAQNVASNIGNGFVEVGKQAVEDIGAAYDQILTQRSPVMTPQAEPMTVQSALPEPAPEYQAPENPCADLDWNSM